MPATHAHYRFGTEAVQCLTGEVGRSVRRFRALYDTGTHGPDIFFYNDPFSNSKAQKIAKTAHGQSGQEFFGHAVQVLRQSPSEGGTAYLFGLLTHYALDAACHPIVAKATADGKIGHTELETEFDRYLLHLEGVPAPHTRDVGSHIRLSQGECHTVADFYPESTGAMVARCTQNMRRIHQLLAKSNRPLVEAGFRLIHQEQLVMTPRTNRNCSGWDEALLEGYTTALSRYPALADELTQALKTGQPLGENFAPSFA